MQKKQQERLFPVRKSGRQGISADALKELFREWYGFDQGPDLFGALGMEDAFRRVGFLWRSDRGYFAELALLLWSVVGEAEDWRCSKDWSPEKAIHVFLSENVPEHRSGNEDCLALFVKEFQEKALRPSFLGGLRNFKGKTVVITVQGRRITDIRYDTRLRVVSG
jgi:hypothetical protein